MEHKRSDIDARNNLVVNESLLQFVSWLVGPLNGEFFDLGQLGGEGLASIGN